MAKAKTEYMVACAGAKVEAVCAVALSDFLRFQDRNVHRFVMSDWLEKDQLCEADVLWIVDHSPAWDTAHLAMSCGIPLLVPEDATAIKETCEAANCGLLYRDAKEARLCLELLLRNDRLRNRLGANGRNYIVSSVSVTATTS